jgi:predicted dehydrogenase
MTPWKISIIGTRGHHAALAREVAGMEGIVQLVGAAPGGNGDGVVDVAKWGEAGRGTRVFDDYGKMLAEAEPDMVIVCGAFELHATMCTTAIERGVHVLTEKPAALTLDDLDRLRDACTRHPSVHLAGMMFSRYSPGFYTASKLIHGGAIGEVRLINAQKSYQIGRRDAYYHGRATYGGTIPWVGSHAIDWVLWFTDREIESVYATQSAAHNDGNGTMESAALCHLTLEGGAAASVSIDFFRPPNAPTHGDDWCRVVGTQGVMEIRRDSIRLINADNDGATPVLVSCDRTPLQDFTDHARGRRQSIIDRDSTLKLTEACLLARQSADEAKLLRPRGSR